VSLTILIALIVASSSCRALYYNIPDITDHTNFPSRTIKNAPDNIFQFLNSDTPNNIGDEVFATRDYMYPDMVNLNSYIEDSKTAAFIIIRNDSVLYEKYNKAYQENTIFNIFSVTKAFVTTLIGIAIDEGLIDSVDQAITDYLPEFTEKKGFSEITIRHLLLHTSGIEFSDSKYNPLSDNARYYYGRNLRKLVLKAELYEKPGISTHYASVNTQLLGLILERASKTTLSDYLQEKIWKEIGMQYNATWNTDYERKDPFEKSFASLNCTAIDLAKLGRLYLNKGMWEDKRILSKEFIQEATCRDTSNGSCLNFQYNFRPGPMHRESYYAVGLFGQLIIVYPYENIIVVRVGEADWNYNPPFIRQNMIQIIDQFSLNI